LQAGDNCHDVHGPNCGDEYSIMTNRDGLYRQGRLIGTLVNGFWQLPLTLDAADPQIPRLPLLDVPPIPPPAGGDVFRMLMGIGA